MESIVVDANKFFAAFIKKGIVHELLFSGKFKPIGPEKLSDEVKKHKEDIAEKSGMKSEDVQLAIELLEPEFKIFKRELYSDKLNEAERLSPHSKDVEYFALALKSGFSIWSNEKDFKKQSEVKIFLTKELKEFLDENSSESE